MGFQANGILVQAGILVAHGDVIGKSLLQSTGKAGGTGRTIHGERQRALVHPACDPQVIYPEDMVRVQVCQENRVNFGNVHPKLGQPWHDAATGIKQQDLATRFNQNCRTGPVRVCARAAGAQQRHPHKVSMSCERNCQQHIT